MIQLVDIKKQLSEAIMSRRKSLLVFVFSTILIVGLDAILMLTSKDNYILELIFSILFTSIYLIFVVYYFTVFRKQLMNELNFYSSASEGPLNEVRVRLVDIEEKKKINNGLEFYVIKAVTKNSLEDVEQFYLLPKKFNFKKGQNKIFRTFGSVVIEVEDEK